MRKNRGLSPVYPGFLGRYAFPRRSVGTRKGMAQIKKSIRAIPFLTRRLFLIRLLDSVGLIETVSFQAFFAFLRRRPAIPASPAPKSNMVAGSGTGAIDSAWVTILSNLPEFEKSVANT